MTPRPSVTRLAPVVAPARLLPLALAIAAGAGCGPRRASWDEVRVPEAYVETLPTGAEVAVDGAPAGRSPLSVRVPDPSRKVHLQAAAPGFEPADLVLDASRIAGQRLDVVLRPAGFGAQRRLDLGEPVGLAQAGAALLKAGRVAEALAFAEASLAVAETPLAHKVAGEANRRLGNRNGAIRHYSTYVTLLPDAPDRKAIEAAIAEARGDLTIPAPRPE
jgi:tetratricopeptide (TPR) repeat protein